MTVTKEERTCGVCGSHRIKSKGVRKSASGKLSRRFKCKDCGTHYSVRLEDNQEAVNNSEQPSETKEPKIKLITPTLDFDALAPNRNGVVVTSVLNDTPIFKEFFETLEKYCELNNFELFVIKNKYLNPSAMNMGDSVSYPPEIEPYVLGCTVKWRNKFKIIGDCNIQATATHPLTGIDGLCEGMTSIVGHPVVQMKTLPVNEWRDPIILHSTGSVSAKNHYSATKAGYRASFHHCFSAVVVQFDKDDSFHIRQLMADGTGSFHDLDKHWTKNGFTYSSVEAVVFGDEHVIFGDKEVYQASFYDQDSMVNVLKPKYMIRHDVFDAISCGKHDVNRFFARFKKHQKDYNSIEYELNSTLDHLVKSTPEFSTTLIVHSNHDDHLDQFLETYGDPKHDYVNAELYYNLMWRKLREIREQKNRTAFRIYAEDVYTLPENVKFMTDGFSLHGIQLSLHGSSGNNGARPSIRGFSQIGEKLIIGHSHSPNILGGVFQTGTTAIKNMDYLSGASSWMHTNCILHKNGKRQLINVINGKWKP